MVNMRIYKYPDKKTIEVKIDYDKDLFKFLMESGFKRAKGWYFKTYFSENKNDYDKYKIHYSKLIDSSKYKRVEIFKFIKRMSNVDHLLKNIGAML